MGISRYTLHVQHVHPPRKPCTRLFAWSLEVDSVWVVASARSMNDEAMSAVDAAAGVMQRGMQAGNSVDDWLSSVFVH